VPVGAPCNICEPEDPIYAAIHRMNEDGTDLELFASGVRNTVGFTGIRKPTNYGLPIMAAIGLVMIFHHAS
jgi:glucose/arabinose dehydrogenase